MSRGKIKKFADRCESLQNRGNLLRYVVIFDMMRVQKRAVWLNALLSDGSIVNRALQERGRIV